MENLSIQFVYGCSPLPPEWQKLINSIDHVNIMPVEVVSKVSHVDYGLSSESPQMIVASTANLPAEASVPVVVRTTLDGLVRHQAELISLSCHAPHVSVVLTDMDRLQDADIIRYHDALESMAKTVAQKYRDGLQPSLGPVTDRARLNAMNNCGAGTTTVTLAPNGRFYVCPAFYATNESDSIGSLEEGLNIPNQQLYTLEYAPLCRHCDAYQCRRCIWLNRMKTLEVNTPSHEQCVAAHHERNASRHVLPFFPEADIPTINYLDPFDNREAWQ